MLDNLPGGPWIWGIAIVGLVLVVIIMNARRAKSAFGKPYERYEVTEIPPETPGTRDFIVRDDGTGARLQFVVSGPSARIEMVVVPPKHLGTGAEAGLFRAALPAAPGVDAWTWPPLNADGYTMLLELAHEFPHLAFYDSDGIQLR
ncbi:hypothetical protein KXS11_08095 [Plantibacter flavus]|uniref:hypothetical protein n=1 Tax=Plantibacter flavus TaxID=150123 RepID=UPI003F1610D3